MDQTRRSDPHFTQNQIASPTMPILSNFSHGMITKLHQKVKTLGVQNVPDKCSKQIITLWTKLKVKFKF